MFTLNYNSNKHKVAFYVALVILLVTLRQSVDATEVISHSSPKNTSTDVSVIRGYDANKSVTEKLTEIRQLLRSLIFDCNLGESGIENGRTFGRIRMMKNILLPVAFIGGFLTAVIFSIKAIGIVNLFLISSLLALNFAMIMGKLLYAKKFGNGHGHSQTHYHAHYNQPYQSYGPSYGPSYGSYGGSYSSAYAHADSRADQGSPFGRNLNQQPPFVPTGPQAFPPTGNGFPQQNPGFNPTSLPFGQQTIPQNSAFPPQANPSFNPAGSSFPQTNQVNPTFNPQATPQNSGFPPQANPTFNPSGTSFPQTNQVNPSFNQQAAPQSSGFSPQVNPTITPTGSSFPQTNQGTSGFNPSSNSLPCQLQSYPSQQSMNSQNPTAFSNLQQPQQPPSDFRPQMNTIPQNINNNPFSNLQMQSPQQVQQQQPTSNSFNQPLNQFLSQMQDMNF